MARTQKWNDHHSGSERYFTHNGHPDEAPNHFKKSGAGRGSVGVCGAELEDLISSNEIPPVFKKERRGSNHSLNEERFAKIQNRVDTFAGTEEEDEEDEDDYDYDHKYEAEKQVEAQA